MREFRDRTGATGTVETMAPELLVEIDGQYVFRHSFASDVCSLGVILFKIFFRVDPFTVENGMATEFVIDLLRRMLVRHPPDRITMRELYENATIIRMLNEFGLAQIQERFEPDGPPVPDNWFATGTVLAISFDSHEGERWVGIREAIKKYKMQGLLLVAGLSIAQSRTAARIIHIGTLLWLILLSLKIQNIAFLIPIVSLIEFFVLKSTNVYQILLFDLVALFLNSDREDQPNPND
jgi:hypothetical protein